MDAVDRLFALVDAKYREQYDYCVSRAVANAATLSEYCLPSEEIFIHSAFNQNSGSVEHICGLHLDRERRKKPGSRRSRTDAGICPDFRPAISAGSE